MARRYQVTCTCRAYDFPHRFGGGRCDGSSIVEEHCGGWLCQHCNLFNGGCEVMKGQERPNECAYVIEFCEYNEVKLPR
uniref:Uncharacterized protein n=1 Tax=Salmonella phage PMBT35 TaxID=3137287 RepID=A0AAU8BVN0_9VIRU